MFFDTIALRRLLALILIASSALWAAPSHSGEFDILKGKEIRAIIGGKPGAGTDVTGRTFFAALGRVLPETTIHIQTISGGAGAAAVKELVGASGDLITVSIFGNGPLYTTLMDADAMPFDISKLQWIGSLASSRRVVAMRTSLGPPSFETLLNLDRQPLTPSTGAGSPNNIESLLVNAITGLHLKVVPGFEDAQIETMLMAGDADVRLAGSFQITPMIESGDMVAVLRMSDGTYPESMQKLPTLAEVALPDTPKELVLLMETLNRLGRPYAAAPDTDPAIVAALRSAFLIAIEDPEFVELMSSDGNVGGATGGEQLQTALDTLMSNPDLRSIAKQGLECGRAMSEDPAATCR